MTKLEFLEKQKNFYQEKLDEAIKDFAQWEKQLVHDYQDPGDETGISILRNIPWDECKCAEATWKDIARLKLCLINVDAGIAALKSTLLTVQILS